MLVRLFADDHRIVEVASVFAPSFRCQGSGGKQLHDRICPAHLPRRGDVEKSDH